VLDFALAPLAFEDLLHGSLLAVLLTLCLLLMLLSPRMTLLAHENHVAHDSRFAKMNATRCRYKMRVQKTRTTTPTSQ
jgi:hypothetical protein